MNALANPDMVSLVREARGWSQSDLAKHAELTQGYVSKVENGLSELRGTRLEAVAAALECPPELLTNTTTRRGLEISCMFHRRRRSKISVTLARKIEAISHLTRLSVEALTHDLPDTAPAAIERLDIDSYDGDAQHIAQLVRARLRVPGGPVSNVFDILDTAGVIAVIRPIGTAGQDAFSVWAPNMHPLMVINDGLPTDRLRFSAIHELGHLVMHLLPNDNQEEQANLFAAEFLMPAEQIRPHLHGLTTRDFPRLLELKATWKVSVGALIQRAKTLGEISDRQFREFRIRLSEFGWNSVEPVDLPDEAPHLLDNVIALHRREHGYTTEDLARLALMTPTAFERYYIHDESQPHLKVV